MIDGIFGAVDKEVGMEIYYVMYLGAGPRLLEVQVRGNLASYCGELECMLSGRLVVVMLFMVKMWTGTRAGQTTVRVGI